MQVGTKVRRIPWGAALIAVMTAAALAAGAAPARAASVSPRVLESARRSPVEAAALRDRMTRLEASKALGVDKIYKQFALDLAKYPRGGVAHRNLLVVLAEFPAEGTAPAWGPNEKSTPFYYWRLLFSDDPNDGIISLREYYAINSHGRLIISGAVTSKWLMMPHSYRYYANGSSGLGFGAYPRSSQKLAEDAMAAAYVDFDKKLTFFDNDGPDGVSHSGDDDGYIDATLVIHPGRGSEIIIDPVESDNSLWSHEAGIAQYTGCDFGLESSPNCVPGLQLGDVRGFLYVMLGEYNDYPGDFAVGTYAHEFGHTLGLPDLYDPAAAGLGFYSLMALGNYLPYEAGLVLGAHPGSLDAWSRQFLGFDPPMVATQGGHYTLAPLTQGGSSLLIWKNGEPGTEYFLVENRRREGPDEFLPGEGLVVYHVNDTQTDNLGGPGSYRVAIVQADGDFDLEDPSSVTGNFGDDSDPFPGSLGITSLTDATTPSTRDLNGDPTGIQITNIQTVAGSDSISFDLILATQPELRVTGVTIADGGDGYADPNETVDLSVALRNAGLASGALTYTLSEGDPYATVTTAGSTGAAIAAGGTGSTATPFTVAFTTPPTLPYDVTFNLGWTDGSSSGATQFTVTLGMGSGLAESFESGALGWSHIPIAPSADDEWHASGSRAHAGATSMKLGSANPLGVGSNEAQTYASEQDAALVSPAFDLAPNQELVFWSYIDAETNGGTGAWDGGRVEISLNGGEWTPLAVDGGYGYIMEFNSSAALRGSDVFSGTPQSWRRVVADLSPYSGAARIRFRFASDEANDPRTTSDQQLRYYEGWYVDDVAVQGRAGGGPIARKLSLRAGPNPYRLNGPSSGSVHFRFSAPDGLAHPGLAPDVRIFDVRGRQVGRAAAAANPLVPAEYQATWTPRSASGENLGSGIYFAKVDVLGSTQTVRLVLVR